MILDINPATARLTHTLGVDLTHKTFESQIPQVICNINRKGGAKEDSNYQYFSKP